MAENELCVLCMMMANALMPLQPAWKECETDERADECGEKDSLSYKLVLASSSPRGAGGGGSHCVPGIQCYPLKSHKSHSFEFSRGFSMCINIPHQVAVHFACHFGDTSAASLG